jgi:alkylation response protein AidB-like acyl-CoA dehydrogenase
MLDNENIPYHEAPMLKVMASETEQRLVNTAMQILGPYGQLKKGSKWAPIDGFFEWRYRESLESLIVRGTSEIMRTIIAERGLGLPRA